MRVLGIDPGIGRCGWGVVDYKSSKFSVFNYGCIETKPNGDTSKRLHILSNELKSIIKKYKPEELAVEQLFFNTNAKTAFIVGEARGVVLLTAAQNEMPVTVYTPLQIKIALTGYGRAEKDQVGKMVQVLLKLKSIPKPDDTTDALAVAIAHCFSYNNNKLYDRLSPRDNRSS